MGLCSSQSEGAKQTRAFDQRNEEDHNKEQEKIKLLLLGAGESGKSTIFKQMRILYGKGISMEDRVQITPVVYSNTITSMRVLIENCDNMGIAIENQAAVDDFANVPEDHQMDSAVGGLIKQLWEDPGIQEVFAMRAKFQLNDSAEYYFKRIDEIMADDYVATVQDLLRSRVRTSGIVEDLFVINDVDFVMYDVGGQRNERKKWIHCFDNVTAVIFVAAISAYDQVLVEDGLMNRLEEAINLYEQICNLKFFEKAPIMLFLNKKDLFEEKIKRVDIYSPADERNPARFEDYQHGTCTCGGGYPSDYDCTCGIQDKAKEYLENQFVQSNDHEVHPHITCATDTSNIKFVFNTCKDIILQQNIVGSGFMD